MLPDIGHKSKQLLKTLLDIVIPLPVIGGLAFTIEDYYYEARHQRQTKAEDLRLQPIIASLIAKKTQASPLPLFTKVEIETLNRCNHICPFCPVNRFIDPRPLAKMDEKLFKKIIDDLASIDYHGSIALFSNNEPLIDIRIYQFLKYAKKKLPHAFHYLYTNGTLLNLTKFLKLMKYLDHLHIDNYSDTMEIIPPIKPIAEYIKTHPKLTSDIKLPGERGALTKPKVFISMRRQTERLTTRGGQSRNRGQIKPLKSSCILPYTQLVIRPDGKISLCCNDTYGIMTLGDTNTQTVKEIWYGSAYLKVRQLIRKDRQEIPICKGCDTLATD